MHERVKVSVYVPSELHRKAKYASFEKGITIQRVVEDALQEKLNPQHRHTSSPIRPQEVKVLQTQLKQILESGDELAIASCVAAIRGHHKWLRLDPGRQRVVQVKPVGKGRIKKPTDPAPLPETGS